jgi:exosortase A-associated hydrolase 2
MNPAEHTISPEFLSCQGTELFTLTLQPEGGPARGVVLFLPPFGEEMNKSRRTVALNARALAAAGYCVMLLDPSGCGDSSGDFCDATWGDWKRDADCAITRLKQLFDLPITVWGLRLGALLACEVAVGRSDIHALLLWQPVLNGEQHIDQFLRFELAGRALKGNVGFDRASLWDELRNGRPLQVAGYHLSARLALEIARSRLADLHPGCPVTWLDISRPPATEPGVASANVIGLWRKKGIPVTWACSDGEAFWRNVDAPDSSALPAATLAALSGQ